MQVTEQVHDSAATAGACSPVRPYAMPVYSEAQVMLVYAAELVERHTVPQACPSRASPMTCLPSCTNNTLNCGVPAAHTKFKVHH